MKNLIPKPLNRPLKQPQTTQTNKKRPTKPNPTTKPTQKTTNNNTPPYLNQQTNTPTPQQN
jgi:hypothetical protein